MIQSLPLHRTRLIVSLFLCAGITWAFAGGSISGIVSNQTPYTGNYMFSIQRQFTQNALLTVSFAGNQGHHLLVTVPTNTGNPGLCLSLSQPDQVAPGSSTCGPFGESGTYTSAAGHVYQGTRLELGSNFGPVTAQQSIGNSNYNALETNLRFNLGKRSTVLLAYTYSKSIDDASNLGEQINPLNQRLTRNGRPAFNTGLFAPESMGVLGNAARRMFHGPGIEDFDMQLSKTIRLTEARGFDIRVEAFNVFNQAQFYGRPR